MVLFSLFLFRLFEFQETGGLADLVSARGAVADLSVATSLNPSLFSSLKTGGFNFTFTHPYSLPELNYMRVCLLLKKWDLGFSSAFLVRASYTEETFSMGKGFAFSPSLSLGTLLSLYRFAIKDYDSDFLFSLSPSVSFTSNRFIISLLFLHTNQPKTLYGERLPFTLIFGVMFSFSPGTNFYFDYEREKEETFRGGLKMAHKAFYWGIGFETNPIGLTSGFGISLKVFDLSYGIRWHSQLRESHIINFGLKSSP
uniref:PorV/PorQ family protein n=1 Tax=candidate division WOR-3 bacterium TaxID=2052148 RepID=A0A7C3UXK3_UNCW3